MIAEYLEWDSIFFGVDVYRGKCKSAVKANEIQLNKGLTYLFCKEEVKLQEKSLFDVKITFAKRLTKKRLKIDSQIISYPLDNKVSKELLNLTYQSGQYSRFKIDPKIPNDKFLDFYKLWISNSVNRSFSNEVFTYKIDGIDVGLITLKKDKETCKIGLLSVDEVQRGKKIGSKLMLAAEKWALDNECKEILVETQEQNKIAVAFYKRMKYNIVQKEYIYHLWR
ncbi:GNAT family N-acetyltransferase [Polaribacter sp. R2A056_3_33]|uniref:GNAT family N-acetyltransferase n=1 Tax=Polaribacter sp. R2A056_3_33 TaxID=2745563 RepID=UPI001C501FCB|nr:GNAT family N-acetyltransferase [Polaribacter sp. R2A056_3_33]QXP69635.1 GNAT family N-acetyltransferase [Polaribacter sp. R2A056_3_33]